MRTPPPATSAAPRIIATDVDGTLLRSDHTLSARTLAVLSDALGAGWLVVPVSGRQPSAIRTVVAGTPLLGHCIGSNGAVGMDLLTGLVLFEQTIDAEAQSEFVERMRREIPGVLCAAVRDAGRVFVPEEGYIALMDPGDHGRTEPVLDDYPLADVVGTPSTKIVLRHPVVRAEVLLDTARRLGVPGVHPSTSGAPFLEVAAGGVTKASGMQRMCDLLGRSGSDVVAFGDNNNDAELLAWAGHGVAMGNALPEALAAADEVTATNDDDGLALVVERLLAGAATDAPAR